MSASRAAREKFSRIRQSATVSPPDGKNQIVPSLDFGWREVGTRVLFSKYKACGNFMPIK
jgi:hypothetical protein